MTASLTFGEIAPHSSKSVPDFANGGAMHDEGPV